MGPMKGCKKVRKRRKVEPNSALASLSSEEGSGDWWDALSLTIPGLKSPSKDSNTFESIFKISRKTFDYICSLVKEQMTTKPLHLVFNTGIQMSLYDQVAVALRRLSSGDSLIAVADFFGTNHSTVSQATWRFVEAIEQQGLPHLRWPSTEEEFSEIKSKFEKLKGLPNCCGAIDTTHIHMLMSSSDAETKIWIDSEKNHSMVVQAIVDPDLRILDIVTGWPGKLNDFSILQSSNFHYLCEKGERLNGKKMKISEGVEIREYIVGDSGFPLTPWLLTPYQGKQVSEIKTEYNKRHFASRVVAQRALSRLKEMWRIIQGKMWRPDKNRLPRIILACCILHNIVIDMEDGALDELPLTHHHDKGYKQEICEFADKSAVDIRDKLSLYISSK